MEQYDDIDRALFSLPLEEPPQGLRDSILAITVRAPQPERARLGLFENVGVGVALALLVWFTWDVVANPAFAGLIYRGILACAQGLSNPLMLVSLAIGFSAIFMVSLMPLKPARVQVRSGRS